MAGVGAVLGQCFGAHTEKCQAGEGADSGQNLSLGRKWLRLGAAQWFKKVH